jgi:hypothetical protein
LAGEYEKVVEDLTSQLNETVQQKEQLEARLRSLSDLEDCKRILSEDSASSGYNLMDKSTQETIVSLSKQLSETIKQNMELEAKLERSLVNFEENERELNELKQSLGNFR